MDIRQLRYFVAVIDNASITKAAEQLAVAQPAVGNQVRNLETELGIKLLVRHSRGVEPTVEGEILYREAKELIRGFEDLKLRMEDLASSPRGTITVGMTPSLRNLLGKHILEGCGKEIPGVEVNIVEGLSTMLAEWLVADRVDLALLYDLPENYRGVRGKSLAVEPLYLVRHRTMACGDDGTILFNDLARTPLAMPALKDEILHRLLASTAEERNLSLNIACVVQSMSAVRELVFSGEVATALPYGALLPDIERGELIPLKIVEPEIPRVMCFAHSDRRPMTKPEIAVKNIVGEVTWRLRSEHPEIWTSARDKAT